MRISTLGYILGGRELEVACTWSAVPPIVIAGHFWLNHLDQFPCEIELGEEFPLDRREWVGAGRFYRETGSGLWSRKWDVRADWIGTVTVKNINITRYASLFLSRFQRCLGVWGSS